MMMRSVWVSMMSNPFSANFFAGMLRLRPRFARRPGKLRDGQTRSSISATETARLMVMTVGVALCGSCYATSVKR